MGECLLNEWIFSLPGHQLPILHSKGDGPWLAGGGRLPSPGRGAHTTCCLPRAAHPRHGTPSFPLRRCPYPPRSPGPDSGGRAGEGRRRRVSGRARGAAARAAPAPRGSPAAARAERCGRAGRRGSRAEERLCLWQARHAPPPPLRRRALLSRLSPPLTPGGTRSGRSEGAVGGDLPLARGGRAGRRVGGAAAARWGPAHPRGRLSRLRGPRAPSRPPRPATPSH